MSRVLVSLVSHQTIPNILLIKDQIPFDQYLFISTKEMEKEGASRSEWIIETCGLSKDDCTIEQVKEDDLDDIRTKLDQLKLDFTATEILVNITGGTKIMTLAVFNYFSAKSQVNFLYKHIKNYAFINLKEPTVVLPIKTSLTVKEYLQANGILTTKDKAVLKPEHETVYLFEKFIAKQVDLSILESLRKHYRGKGKKHRISDIETFHEETESEIGKRIPGLGAFLEQIQFTSENDGTLTKQEIDYLTGGWFEEFVYHKIKSIYPDVNVLLGVVLQKGSQSNENDLDVVFCVNDILGVIECKTSLLIDGKYTQLFNETVYKASALRSKFGLSARSYLFTLDDFLEKKEELKEKAKILGIALCQHSDIMELEELKRVLPKP